VSVITTIYKSLIKIIDGTLDELLLVVRRDSRLRFYSSLGSPAWR
jgi:hypothetical protein